MPRRKRERVQLALLLLAAALAAVGCNGVLGIKEKHYTPLAAAGSSGTAAAKDAGPDNAASLDAGHDSGVTVDAGPGGSGTGVPTLSGGIVSGGEPRTNAVGYTLLDDGFETSDFVSNANGYQLSGGIVP